MGGKAEAIKRKESFRAMKYKERRISIRPGLKCGREMNANWG